VRGLYWVFDLIGDFGPMFSALFKFLGRSSLVVVNLVILAGTIVMSAAHSLALLRYAGLRHGLEWVGVIVWELAFIFSSIILANDYRRGNWRSGWAPWLGFALGFTFVEASNYLGMADNYAGRIIGICTPILLLVSKGLLAHQFKTRTHDESHTESHTAGSHTESRTAESHTESHTAGSHTAGSHTESHTAESHNKESHIDTQPHKPRDPREVAEEYYEKCGELPSIRGLAAEAGCSEWAARTTLRDLKKKLGIENKKTQKKRVAR